jgi:hypothetical protein
MTAHDPFRPVAYLLELLLKLPLAAILMLVLSTSASAEPLQCNVGPIVEILGGSEWQVTSCSDDRSLVFATVKGNPAMPFVFIVQRTEETAKISGEGNGSKEYSAAAYEELKAMTAEQFDELVRATKHAANEK